jgi:hypothetical protein
LSFVDLPIEPLESRKAAVGAVESDITSNTGEGRMYVMLINGVSHLTCWDTNRRSSTTTESFTTSASA